MFVQGKEQIEIRELEKGHAGGSVEHSSVEIALGGFNQVEKVVARVNSSIVCPCKRRYGFHIQEEKSIREGKNFAHHGQLHVSATRVSCW